MTDLPPNIDIRPDQWNIVHKVLQRHVPDCKVIAFGSRAKWSAREYSDLDLAIVGDGPVPHSKLADLEEDFSESRLLIKVDIVDWATIDEKFREVIGKDAVVVQAARATKETAGTYRIETWKDTTIGEFCAFSYGKSLPEGKRDGGEFPVFGSNGIVGQHSEPLVDRGVVIGRKGSAGAVHYSPEPFWPIDTTFFVGPSEERDIRFTYYLLLSLRLSEMNSDSAVPGLNRNAAHARRIRVPSLAGQRYIAGVLGTLDDKIEANRKMNQTLEAMAQAIFKDWFVDFGPTRAKMEGREPYLPPEIWDLFPDTLDDEGKPDGWTRDKIKNLFRVSIGRTPPRKQRQNFVTGDLANTWLSIKDMRDIQVFAHRSKEDLTSDAVAQFRIPPISVGTVLVSFKLTVGRVAIAAKKMYSNEAIAHLVMSDTTPVSSVYTYCYMKNYDYSSLGSTSSIANAINSQSVKDIDMILSSTDIHDVFTMAVKPMFDQILVNIEETRALKTTYDRILPKLVSGAVHPAALNGYESGVA